MGTANDHRVVRILRALIAFPRILRLYPVGHARVEVQVNELHLLLRDVFSGRKEPLCFTVRGVRVELNGELIDSAPELTSDLAFKLRRRRIRSLILLPGLGRSELRLLAELFSVDYKQLQQIGGAHAFLDRSPHPHLQVSTFRADGEDSDEVDTTDLCPELVECLDDPAVLARMDALRTTLGAVASDDQDSRVLRETFERLMNAFFNRPEWEDLDKAQIVAALGAFLDIVEHTIGQPAEAMAALFQARLESMKSFFRGVAPIDLTRTQVAEPAEPARTYTREKVEDLLAEPGSDLKSASRALRQHIESHSHDETALLILCELMVSATTREEFQERRHMFLASICDQRYSSSSVARILRHIAIEMPPVSFEPRDELIQAVFDNTRDEDGFTLFLVSMTDRPDVARPILKRLSGHASAFPLIVRLMTAPLLRPFRHILADRLLELGRLKRQALTRWARKHRDQFFMPEVFGVLFSQGAALVGPICKDILQRGSPADRAILIRRLEESGSETALRLLVLGITYGDEPCDQELVRALGRFNSPLAVSVLKDVVHRANVTGTGIPSASTALVALERLGTEDSHGFLFDVAGERAGFLFAYRKELRKLAVEAMARPTQKETTK